MIQQMLAIWSLVPLPFLNPACTSESSQFIYCWNLAWRILSTILTSMWNEHNCMAVWTVLALSFFGIEMKTDLLQSWGHCWAFQICWHIECSTFTASSFRIWNSSAGIPSPPLALFIVMLPKAHFTLHARMSAFRWVMMPSWLSRSLIPYLNSTTVYSCHLFLISSTFIKPLLFPSCIVPILAWNVPLISPVFWKRPLVFPILLFSSVYLHCSFKKAFLSLPALLWKSAFS